jgi:hypothetical protein
MSELLNKMLDIGESAIRRHIGKKEPLLPVWHLMQADGKSIVVGTPFDGPREKNMVFDVIRRTMRQIDCIAYCFTNEAWTMPPMTAEEVKRISPTGELADIRPSVMPNRIEVFVATASDGTTIVTRMWDIRRDKRGRVQAIIKRDLDPATEFRGTVPMMLHPDRDGESV